MIRSERQSGYTLVEFLIVVSVFATFVLGFSDAFTSATVLVGESRGQHRAEERLRRNIEALANVLRGADLGSVTGFDINGRAIDALQFARIDTVDRDGPVYLGHESVEWRPATRPVNGVASPGRLVHVLDGKTSVIATRVPKGGFEASFKDGALVIRVVTYHPKVGRVSIAEGETAVSPRN